MLLNTRLPEDLEWELYNLANDRCELNDLADQEPQRLKSIVSRWEQLARRVGVTWKPQVEGFHPEIDEATVEGRISRRELRLFEPATSRTNVL